MIEKIDENTSLIVIVTPNNPTGLVATKDDITNITNAAINKTVLVDLAYTEFANEDLTNHALQYGNCVVVRSLSKAYGLAGLRVGYAIGNAWFIEQLEKAGGPYSVSSLSCALAIKALQNDSKLYQNVKSIKENRTKLTNCLNKLSIKTSKSQGNFVLAESSKSKWIKDNLAGFGISIRSFEKDPDLKNSLRITIPPINKIDRVIKAIETVINPQAILFDMDGVLADVSKSYRQTIIETAKGFGVNISNKDINQLKEEGNSNNDWLLTQKLICRKGFNIDFEKVKTRFEQIYQGTADKIGLRYNESLIPDLETLIALNKKIKLGIVTGRPIQDAEIFLNRFKIKELFEVVITLEDAKAKPSPEPVTFALDKLNIKRAWMIGDTPDDIIAARKAGVLPLGINAPGANDSTRSSLIKAGAGRILKSINEIREYL